MSKQVSGQNSKSLTNLKESDEIDLIDTKSKFDHLRQSLHLARENEKCLSGTNLVDFSSELNVPDIKPNIANVFVKKKELEIFDPSLKFIAIYRCYYWSKNDNIRKGKIFLTGTELFFKCPRTSFLKLRLHFSEITNVVRIKNYKHKFETVVSVDTSFGSSYAFYKFRMPKTVVRTNILQLIEEYKRVNQLGDSEPEHTHLMKFRKFGQPISNLKGVLRQSMHRQNSDEFEEDKPEPRFKSFRRLKLDRSKSSELNGQKQEPKKHSKFIKKPSRSYEHSSHDEREPKPEPESCSLASTLDSSEEDSIQLSETESDIDEEMIEEHIQITEEEILVENSQNEYINLKSSFLITLFITFISIIVFFVLALNNFKRLSSIERKILELI